jgi:hypothetical protein
MLRAAGFFLNSAALAFELVPGCPGRGSMGSRRAGSSFHFDGCARTQEYQLVIICWRSLRLLQRIPMRCFTVDEILQYPQT